MAPERLHDTMVLRAISRLRRSRGAVLAPAMFLGLAAAPAQAQFNWFGPREASPQDVSDTIADHGFTLVGPLYRNGRVYLADVIDRRRRRERLVIAADSGEIVQRFFVDVGPERRAPIAVPRQAPRDDSFFSHLTRGWDDEPPPRPPVGLPGQDTVTVPAAPLIRAKPQPKIVTRTEAAPIPVTAAPLPPPGSATSKPETVTVPSPAPSGDAGSSRVRGTSVSTDPLSIPGTRKAEENRGAKPANTATVAASKPAEPAAAATPTLAKPKPAPTADVPVAPLD